MKGAYSNYVHGQIYSVPADYAQWKFWVVVENPPEIKAPEASKEDSVFGDEVFIPPTENTSSIAPTPILTVSTPEPEVTTKQESVVTHGATHDDKPIQDEGEVVMYSIPVNLSMEDKKDKMIPLTEEGDEPDEEMPPELVAEMKSLGEELPGEQPLQKRRGRKKKVQ